ncbi:MAG: serine/threonine protein kinase [Planctomycetales bacterium]
MAVSVKSVLESLAWHGICSSEQVRELESRYQGCDDPSATASLCKWLVRSGAATEYQTAILQGKSSGVLKLGPYLVVGEVTRGRLAGMLKAKHAKLKFPVLLKTFLPGGDHNDLQTRLARFQREARVSIQMDHPHVVRTYHLGSEGEGYFLALEDLRGGTLMELIHARGRGSESAARAWDFARGQSNPQEVCRLIWEASLGLAHLHEQGITHRDVTPHNIWVTPEGRVKLMGFGLARDSLVHLDSPRADMELADGELAPESTPYLAPEQILRPDAAGASSDLFSLGCVLYHALTSRAPFDQTTDKVDAFTRRNPLPPGRINSRVTEDLDHLVACMTAKNTADRHPSARAVGIGLARCVSADVASTPSPTQSPELVRFLNWVREATATNASVPLPRTGTDGP